MAFAKKTWKDRIAQYLNRRRLTDVDTGDIQTVTVARDEGGITEDGDTFNAATMNDLEDRIEDAFDGLTAADISYSAGVSVADKIDSLANYTSTETVIGKWIDNKPIYRKYISGSITDGDTLVSGVDTFINAFGVMYIASVGRLIPYYEYFQNASYGATVRKVGTNITASILLNGSSSSAGQSNIFIDYTKT